MPISHTTTDATIERPEAFELLRRLELLRSLDDTTLEALVEGVEPVQLQEGQVLIRQGARDDTLYAVASGTLRAVTVAPSGEEKVIERYGPGGVLGDIQLVLGGAWTTTVEAESPCLLYRLRRAVLDALSDREGELLEPLVWIIRSRLGRAQLAEVLPAFFGPLGPGEIENLEEQAQRVTVRRGEALFRQGDPADGWYIVSALKTLTRTLIQKSIVAQHASQASGGRAPATSPSSRPARAHRRRRLRGRFGRSFPSPGRRCISTHRSFPPSASCTMWLACPRATRSGSDSAPGWRTRARAEEPFPG